MPAQTKDGKMKLKDYCRISEAAKFLGIHPDSLRRWERAGKLQPFRHPINGYRLYLIRDLEVILQEVQVV